MMSTAAFKVEFDEHDDEEALNVYLLNTMKQFEQAVSSKTERLLHTENNIENQLGSLINFGKTDDN